MAAALLRDIKRYFHVQAPFLRGEANERDGWNSLLMNITSHPFRGLEIKLFLARLRSSASFSTLAASKPSSVPVSRYWEHTDIMTHTKFWRSE